MHFIDIFDFSKKELVDILEGAKLLKSKANNSNKSLEGKNIVMLFQQPSTRTRVSFEAGINHLGGSSIILDSTNTQISRGESLIDTLSVVTRYADMIIIRNNDHKSLLEFSKNTKVPIINALTERSHPCQIMADILTYEEHRGSIEGKVVAWVGDGNNVTNSWIHAASILGFQLHVSTPNNYKPQEALDTTKDKQNIIFISDPKKAVKDVDLVVTDTWFSMGDKNIEEKSKTLLNYQVNEELMSYAKENALFMHCLPAYRGKEVTSSVIDGKQSVVFDEAENRMHIQKSIILSCFNN